MPAKVKVICQQCGTEFEDYKSKQRKYCSYSCAARDRTPWNKGQPGCYSETTLQKMSEAKRGKPSPHRGKQLGQTSRTNMSEAHKGKRHSVATKRKMSMAHKGKSPSEATKKKMSEGRKRYIAINGVPMKGETHYNWKGGLSFEPYTPDFNEALKDFIRERSGWTCVCGRSQREEGQRLTVHHIDYDKYNNDPGNLIALCRSCNSKANYNRPYWTIYYIEKMEVLFNG